MEGKDEKGIEISLERALKNERVIASNTVVTHLHTKLRLAFYPLADVNVQGWLCVARKRLDWHVWILVDTIKLNVAIHWHVDATCE